MSTFKKFTRILICNYDKFGDMGFSFIKPEISDNDIYTLIYYVGLLTLIRSCGVILYPAVIYLFVTFFSVMIHT